MARVCESCTTPLDEAGRCVTCDARAEGLRLVTRSGFAPVRETMAMLETEGLSPAMEKVPPGRPEDVHHPLWNLYVREEEVPRAAELLGKDWAELLGGGEAAAAAARGQAGIDLDAGVEAACPACGHAFVPTRTAPECPECGLSLGAPADASPDEAQS
ncbi:MAG TPA: hypothetical protein VLS93_09260 [Anaeromyxobacteraceae bacterium]|nr:hypothetical protein [Anaeromyxobacteraceae bacterium]